MNTKIQLLNKYFYRKFGAGVMCGVLCFNVLMPSVLTSAATPKATEIRTQSTSTENTNSENASGENASAETSSEETEENVEETFVKKGYVVVLDPGHDISHSGASKNGIHEERANMKIAQYCKDALEEYSNVTVYLTHEDLNCPFPGEESTECNKKRCEYAASVDADIFVSLHINNTGSSYTRGYELYYPTTNYVPALSSQGYDLVKCIEQELIGLGMGSHGIFTRNSTENKRNDENFYPDGTRADYYNVIRNCKYHEILGVIVEHGYLSNKSDVNQFLNSDEKLKMLGEADARGIAEYLGVHIKTEEEIAAEIEAELAAEAARQAALEAVEKTSEEQENAESKMGILSRIDMYKKNKNTTDGQTSEVEKNDSDTKLRLRWEIN